MNVKEEMSLFIVFLITFQGCVYAEILRTSGGSDFCIVDGRPYSSGERIPRDHVCHICLCHLGRAECSWMHCPPPPEGCAEYTVPEYCNPTLYICPIPEQLIGIRQSRNSDHLKQESENPLNEVNNINQPVLGDCNILGVPYRTGDLMGIASDFCLECRCGRNNMFCSPRCCFAYASYHENITQRVELEKTIAPKRRQKHPLTRLLE